jgi:hypothetical protein
MKFKVVNRRKRKVKGFAIVEAVDVYRKIKLITIGFNGFTRGGWMTDTQGNRELLQKVIKKKQLNELH